MTDLPTLSTMTDVLVALATAQHAEEVTAVAERGAREVLDKLPPEARVTATAELDRVRALAAERLELRDRLAAATRARELLLAGVAHDLRNPLNTLAMSAGLLRDDFERGDVDPTRDLGLVQRMDRATERMQRLIEDLVEASRIEARKLDLARRPEAAAPLVRDAVSVTKPIAMERGATVLEGALDEEARFVVDRARIAQALSKMVALAAKCTGEGGVVRLSVSREGGGITVSAQARAASGITIATPDDGRGGLALLIARGLVELHGGSFAVEGGEALVIRFTLPAAT